MRSGWIHSGTGGVPPPGGSEFITASPHPVQLGCVLIHRASPPQSGAQFPLPLSHFGLRALYGIPCQLLLLWLCLCLLGLPGLPLLLAEDQVHSPEAQEGAHLEEELQPQVPVGANTAGQGCGDTPWCSLHPPRGFGEPVPGIVCATGQGAVLGVTPVLSSLSWGASLRVPSALHSSLSPCHVPPCP